MTPLETGMGGWAVAGWTALLIVLSAFFVAAEFALMAAKQHRLEERAGSAAGRAALRNSAELTLVLAGSQLRRHLRRLRAGLTAAVRRSVIVHR